MASYEYKVLDRYFHTSEQLQDELNFQTELGGWAFITTLQPDGPKYETMWTVLIRAKRPGIEAVN